MDCLYVNVARNREDEEGYQNTELFWSRNQSLTTSTVAVGGQDVPAASLHPLVKRWLPTPFAIASTEETTDYTAGLDNTTTPDLVGMERGDAGGTGIQTVNEGSSTQDWGVERNADLEAMRGFFLDFYLFEPESTTYYNRSFKVRWADQWQIEVIGNATSPPVVCVSEYQVPAEGMGEWVARVSAPILTGSLYGQLHRLWVQPLYYDEFMVVNRNDQTLGLSVVTESPYMYDADEVRADDEDYCLGLTRTPWKPGKLQFMGYSRAWWVYRDIKFVADWTVSSGPRDLPYLSTQGVDTTALRYYQPEGDSRYACSMAVYQGDTGTDPWVADPVGQQQYHWELSVTGPEDIDATYCKRAVVVDSAPMAWPATTVDDGLTEINLFADARFTVTRLDEYRSADDLNSRLEVEFVGNTDDVAAILRPNDRWQWAIEEGTGSEEDPYTYWIRFDGLVDRAIEERWVSGGVYRSTVRVTCLTRWRQLAFARFMGNIPFDGMLRSAVYTELLKQMPMNTTTELSISGLLRDEVLPEARPGEKPAYLPQVGTSLYRAILDLREEHGAEDRFLWVDNGSGTPILRIDTASETAQATLYRSEAEAILQSAEGNLVWSRAGDPALAKSVDDAQFYNVIFVIGRKKTTANHEGAIYEPLVAYYIQPASWKDSSFAQYINVRKPLVVYAPELNTQDAVNLTCYNLATKYAFFGVRSQVTGRFLPHVFPGDRIAVDSGDDPGETAASVTYRVEQMQTMLIHNTLPEARRYVTRYDLEK